MCRWRFECTHAGDVFSERWLVMVMMMTVMMLMGVGLSSCFRGAWPACPAAPSARRSCCPAAPAASAGSCERLPFPAGCSPDAAPDRSAGPPASGSSTLCPETNDKSKTLVSTQTFKPLSVPLHLVILWTTLPSLWQEGTKGCCSIKLQTEFWKPLSLTRNPQEIHFLQTSWHQSKQFSTFHTAPPLGTNLNFIHMYCWPPKD